jgi:hypothetical protein
MTYYFGLFVAVLLTLAFAYLACLCWASVIDGTAAANSDGGLAVGFTVLAVFLGIMTWIGWDR